MSTLNEFINETTNIKNELVTCHANLKNNLFDKNVEVSSTDKMLALIDKIKDIKIEKYAFPEWLKRIEMSTEAKSLCTGVSSCDAVTYKDDIYIYGNGDFIKYNCITCNSEKIDFKGLTITNYARACLIDDTMMVLDGGRHAECKLYDFITNTFTKISPPSSEPNPNTLCRHKNGLVYGFSSRYGDTCILVYDPITRTWSGERRISSESNSCPVCTFNPDDNLIYILLNSTLYKYDPTLDTLTQDFHVGRNEFASPKMHYLNGYLYHYYIDLGMVEVDINAKKWRVIDSKKYEHGKQFCSSVHNEVIYALGGSSRAPLDKSTLVSAWIIQNK